MERRSFLGLVGGAALTGLLGACTTSQEPKGSLEVTLDALCKEYKAEIGLSVHDHSRNKSFDYKRDTSSYEASVVKVPIALTTMRLAKEQGGMLDDEQWQLIEKSVGKSDNDATAQLFSALADGQGADDAGDVDESDADAVSSSAINETYERLGLQRTRAQKTWGDNKTYADDQVRIARGLVLGVDWVDPDDLSFLRSLMNPADESQAWGIGSMQSEKAGDKKVLDVDVKNGWLPNDDGTWNITSMGAVIAEGASYSVGVVSTGFESFAEGQKVISEVIKAYFEDL